MSDMDEHGLGPDVLGKVFIDGEAGTTGLLIRERLKSCPAIERIALPEAARRDREARLAAMARADLVVLCLPDEAAREAADMIEGLGSKAPRLLDASSAHRVAPGWVYGFAELAEGQARAIAQAPLVANPGCYATGAIALLRPLIDAGIVPADHPLGINAISGYSGGGKSMIAAHEETGGPAFELYALGLSHKHVPEIMACARLERRPLFVPSVGHFRQGMLVSIPLHLDDLPGRPTGAEIAEALGAHYGETQKQAPRRVRVLGAPADGTLEPQTLNGTDALELFVIANDAHGHALLVARLDNLGKGAAGAAVQNILLMLGAGAPAASHKHAVHAR